ncbi:acyl-CoA/acyl-ACP dehydrogenase [Antrihabitans sp. YC3-6]|uniref:Acyl-CoA/acyl-ACP dehydrogenase n=1 Tax=Antrihabitans stalagmiti TaxID=2799499 RepID=A0A934NRS1_9NOCA|nr:acyl-CoA dehydrogenase family protein [Antrihabitans stalagmiti]MBJ8340271.1 acyl-CoA/acyl-ACP dehydrogenase [Antrihabitans stalagmiti]
MDFTRDETQVAVAQAANEWLDHASDLSDQELWQSLAAAGLLSLALPVRVGGDGLGVAAVATLLTELGRRAVQSPALATLGYGVLPLVALGGDERHDDILAAVADGAVLTAALGEPGSPFTTAPVTTAVLDGDSVLVSGTKIAVPYADRALRMLTPTDAGIVLISPDAEGVSLVRTPSSTDAPEFAVRLDRVRVDRTAVLTGDVRALSRLALASIGALSDGLLTGATELTSTHIGTRHQFGKPLATFQAVAQEIADIYVTSRTLHVAAVSAVWRLEQGLDADDDLDVVGYWLATEVPAAMQVAHHLHGGLGVDASYPMHRYSAAIKDLARIIGGSSYRLELLGARCTSI